MFLVCVGDPSRNLTLLKTWGIGVPIGAFCNYIYVMTELRFTWDPTKAASNWRKHGISFEEAASVFGDPLHLTEQDRIEGGEYRWQTIGHASGVALLLVAHVVYDEEEGEEWVRIISARRATKQERRRYEEQAR